jgi:hypothetical protein
VTERKPLPHDKDQVKAALQQRVGSVLAALGFNDRVRDGVMTPLNPMRNDRRPGSFVIWLEGAKGLYFKDHSSGEEGDLYELIRWTQRLNGWIDAYWWSLNFLGWGRHEVRSASQIRVDQERAERERRAAEARKVAEESAKAGKAKWFWTVECQVIDWKAPGVVRTYLEDARGLPIERLAAPPGAIRFHPALDHYDRDTGEVTTWPAMVTAMSGPDGDVRAIHRTWLRPDGSGKADVGKAKKMGGVARGCAMRLSKGATKLSPEAAAKKGLTSPLIITEGIEDALTAAIAAPDARVWAAGSLSLLGLLEWPACVSAVVLVADNDWQTPEAISAFERVEAYWRAMAGKRPLKVVRAEVGKDLNDWARGVAA